MSLSKPEFSSQLISKRFDLKLIHSLIHSLDLIRELIALQHRQITGETECMGDFGPNYHKLLKEDSADNVLLCCLESGAARLLQSYAMTALILSAILAK